MSQIKQNTTALTEILGIINDLPEVDDKTKEEQEKSLDVIENGTYDIVPDSEKVLSKATVNVNVPFKEEQTKRLDVTENGSYTVQPDSGKVLSETVVNVAVSERYDEGYSAGKQEGYNEGYQASQSNITLQEKTATENGEVTADEGYTGLSKVNVNVTNADTVDGFHLVMTNAEATVDDKSVITFILGG